MRSLISRPIRRIWSVRIAAALLLVLLPAVGTAAQHAIAMHGEPKYPADFRHFEYVNPEAPKAGSIRLAAMGTFDNLNPFILRGMAAVGSSQPFDTLMVQSADEAFSVYGLVAESIAVAEDGASASFVLRPEARFHDGEPMKPSDVIFSLEVLKTHGHPFYRMYFADVERAEQTGEREVTFYFRHGDNRELPLTVGQLSVFPEHYWREREFERTTLEPPLGSGPYRVAAVDPGRSITYERVDDYWAAELPVNVGRHNFQRIRYDYYRDATVALEAFKAGEYHFREENIAMNWAVGYDTPATRSGQIVLEEIPHEIPAGMQAFYFNTRRAVFQDPQVRKALAYAFDYEWTNQNIFYGAYERNDSYFSNSELAARELPDEEELRLLEPFRDQLPAEVFTQVYEPPGTAEGGIRANLLRALELLAEAGWEVQGRQLVHVETGRPMRFEILLANPSFERVVLPFIRNLRRLGVEARVRTVDSTQYQNRIREFDFDLTVQWYNRHNISPGNEQRGYWGSESARVPGGQNVIGIDSPVIDELVEHLINSPDRETLVSRTRALDRVLLWHHYVIPHWHLPGFRVAYWNVFSRPPVSPSFALGFDTWWVDAEKSAQLAQERGRQRR
jgi:microcin C transport system substrate-binding protein